MILPRLRFLHSARAFVDLKLAVLRSKDTNELIDSLLPGNPHALKVTTEGTIMDGNHRIKVLLERGIDVDHLPREIWEKIE